MSYGRATFLVLLRLPEQNVMNLISFVPGLSPIRVSSIEIRAKQDGFSPMHHLLAEWGSSEQAVVGNLVQALRNIKRDDCVQIIVGDGRNYVSGPQYSDRPMKSQIV